MSEKRKGDAVPGGARVSDTLFGEQMKIPADGAEEKSDDIKLSDFTEDEKITLTEAKSKKKASRGERTGQEHVSFPSSLEKILSMRISEGSVPEALTKTRLGYDITYQEAILLAQVMKALNGDTQAAVFVRDSSGNKPKDTAAFTKTKKFEDL